MRRFAASLLALLSISCAPPPGASVHEESIINGVRETGYPEVVALYWSSSPTSGGLCSGTVIGPYAVLTAKHCVFSETPTGYVAVPPRDMVVVVGHDLNDMTSGITSVHRVLEVRTTPGTDVNADVEGGNDIAILLLSGAIDPAPRAIARSGPAVGDAITIVGFGRTSSSSDASAVKYRGATEVTRTGTRLFETYGGSWTCQGDSGGPAIDPRGAVAGITSFGYGDCRIAASYFTRVAAHTALIDAALAFVPPCSPREETCNDIDDDCDGEIDEIACSALGEPCTTRADCIRASCEDVGGSMICVQQCFPDMPEGACPAGQHCEATGCGVGRCVAGAPGAGADGAACAADTDCASGHCATVAGARICATQCLIDAAACPGGETCEPVDDACGECIPESMSTRPRDFGEACSAGEMCASTLCHPEGFCTSPCASHAECPAEHHCEDGLCARAAPGGAGTACTAAAQCADGLSCSAEGVCVTATPPRGGGCSVGDGPVGGWALLAIALAALGARRRRA